MKLTLDSLYWSGKPNSVPSARETSSPKSQLSICVNKQVLPSHVQLTWFGFTVIAYRASPESQPAVYVKLRVDYACLMSVTTANVLGRIPLLRSHCDQQCVQQCKKKHIEVE